MPMGHFEFGSLALEHSRKAYQSSDEKKHAAARALVVAWLRSKTPIEELETALQAVGLIEEKESNESTK